MRKKKDITVLVIEILFLLTVTVSIIVYTNYVKFDVPYASVEYKEDVCKKFTDLELECEIHKETSEIVPKDRIIVQNPKTIEKARAGDKITLIYSLGNSEYNVPNLNGKTLEEAEKILKSMNLKLEKNEILNNTVFPEGLIISTEPEHNEPAINGSTVKVNISSGKKEIPNFVGKNITEAKLTLENLGYKYKVTEQESQEPIGTIIQQTPKGLSTVDSVVSLTVAKAKPETKTTVPNIIGQEVGNAEIMLAEAGFITLKTQKTDEKATIVDTVTPKVGSEVDPNQIITITLKVG